MDRISQFLDELLLKILSFLPTTKHAVYTMVLSKRWQFLWMMVPKLVYDHRYHNTNWYGEYLRFDCRSFSTFVDRSLFRHEAPVIETLHFKLHRTCGSGDIRVGIRDADKRFVRELIIEFDTFSIDNTQVALPRSLYTCCRMLVTLKLSNAVFADDVSSSIYFPSLKKLSLVSMRYPSAEFFDKLLSGCRVLEDLVVEQYPFDNVVVLRVRVPSLKNLFFRRSEFIDKDYSHWYMIDAPPLECLRIIDRSGVYCAIENNMPKIVKATFDVTYIVPLNILGYVTSVKHLDLCLSTSKNVYPNGSVFHGLVHLRVCEPEWLNLLMCLLRDSPKLQCVKLDQCHQPPAHKLRPCWSEPSSVPECLLSSLETLEWVRYQGAKVEKEVATFILRNANCLKKATIISFSSEYIHRDKKLEMFKELALYPRGSRTCQLLFR